jgi:hypothetical protein
MIAAGLLCLPFIGPPIQPMFWRKRWSEGDRGTERVADTNAFPHEAHSFRVPALCLPREGKIGHAGQRSSTGIVASVTRNGRCTWTFLSFPSRSYRLEEF